VSLFFVCFSFLLCVCLQAELAVEFRQAELAVEFEADTAEAAEQEICEFVFLIFIFVRSCVCVCVFAG
jgi:hypothetical protein